MLIYQTVDALNKFKVGYAVVGGYALALHGFVRATMDIDLVLSLKLHDFEQAEAALNSIGLTSRLPIRAKDIIAMREEYIKNRNLLAWSFVDFKDPSRQVDILINTELRDLELHHVSVAGRKIHLVSLKGLLEMKLAAGRPQDLIDAENIRKKLNEKSQD